MYTSFGPIVRISRANILYFLFLLAAGGMLWYPFQASAASFSCEVTPFSQTIIAGKSINYTVAVTSDVPGSTVKLASGNLPQGVTGEFGDPGFITTPSETSLLIWSVTSAQVANFSITILQDTGQQQFTNADVLCQYNVIILAPAAPGGALVQEAEATAAEAPATEVPAEEDPSTEPQEISVPVLPGAQAPALERKKETPTFVFQSYLIRGSAGDSVVALQDLLTRLGSFPVNVKSTGYFGPITEAAVKHYQKSRGITPTGTVGPITRAALNNETEQIEQVAPSPQFVFQSYLIRGLAGDSVVALQDILKKLGFFPKFVPATGYFGPTTEASVKRYQKNRGIEATGTVGPITRAALNKE